MMKQIRFTYLVTYSFSKSHAHIRDGFRDWLKDGDYEAVFCDESTYGFSTDDSVVFVKQNMQNKLRELYGQEQPLSDDIVNLFCSSAQTDYGNLRDSSKSTILHKIDQHKVLPFV